MSTNFLKNWVLPGVKNLFCGLLLWRCAFCSCYWDTDICGCKQKEFLDLQLSKWFCFHICFCGIKKGQVVKQGIKENKAILKNNNRKSWQCCANPSLIQDSSLWLRNIDGLAGGSHPFALGRCHWLCCYWAQVIAQKLWPHWSPSLVLLWCHGMEEVKTKSVTGCFAAELFSFVTIFNQCHLVI